MREIICVLILICTVVVTAKKMDEIHKWKFIDFDWPSEMERNNAIKSGKYKHTAVVPMDVDRDQAGRLFVTFFGEAGVPATLGIVTNKTGPWGPLVRPYPDWSWFKIGDCKYIQSVYRIAIDKCNRLWVLDTGFVENSPKSTYCQAQLIAFDLNTDKHIKTIKIPNKLARDNTDDTLLGNPIVETEGLHCEKTTVYMANVIGRLIIYNGKDVWALNHTTFQLDPNATIMRTGKSNITWEVGILGMALSPRVYPDEPKYLYYRSLSSFGLYAAETNELRHSINNGHVNYFGVDHVLSNHAAGMAFSSQGTLFFGLANEYSIACYNRYRELSKKNIVTLVKDNKRLVYLNGVKVIRPSLNHPEEELLVLSNNLIAQQSAPKIFMQTNDTKFRVLSGVVPNLIKNTICDLPDHI